MIAAVVFAVQHLTAGPCAVFSVRHGPDAAHASLIAPPLRAVRPRRSPPPPLPPPPSPLPWCGPSSSCNSRKPRPRTIQVAGKLDTCMRRGLLPRSACLPTPRPSRCPGRSGCAVHCRAQVRRHLGGRCRTLSPCCRPAAGRPEPLQVTVVSAMKGVTDALIDLAQLAAKGDEGWRGVACPARAIAAPPWRCWASKSARRSNGSTPASISWPKCWRRWR